MTDPRGQRFADLLEGPSHKLGGEFVCRGAEKSSVGFVDSRRDVRRIGRRLQRHAISIVDLRLGKGMGQDEPGRLWKDVRGIYGVHLGHQGQGESLGRAPVAADCDRDDGERKRGNEQPNRPESNGGKHQRRVLRWCSHCSTSVLVTGSCLVARCVARRAYRSAFTALASPKGQLPFVGR